jgi:glycosyltransferase involved in cell wall biosynthesis
MLKGKQSEVPEAVVVHAGARDRYQLPLALSEGGLLRAFVTNIYSERLAAQRYGVHLERAQIKLSRRAELAYILMKLRPGLDLHDHSNRWLGRKARVVAYRTQSALFACSYYAYEAFKPGPERSDNRILFQIHPHPATVRRTLLGELDRTPAARASLNSELELRLEPGEMSDFSSEAALATAWVVASSHTRSTLAENGIDPSRVHVVPYGVSASDFPERRDSPALASDFKIMFLGSLVQRKGLSDLLDAIRQVSARTVTVCLRGRGFVDHDLLAGYKDVKLDIALNMPRTRIVEELQRSDLLILPSLEEGFGHAILEAMSCGVPVLATDRTCAPDLIEDGVHGFIVPIRDPESIAARIAWALDNRPALAEMGRMAAMRAREYTWERFRAGIGTAYIDAVRGPGRVESSIKTHV